MTETEAIQLASTPDKIVDALQANEVIGFLSGQITDLALLDFEYEIAFENQKAKIMSEDGIIPLKESKVKLSEEYKRWRLNKLELTKLRGLRKVLQKKEEILMFSSRQTRSNYDNRAYLG